MLILSPETEALIRAKAAVTGKSPDQIIQEALGAASATPPPQGTSVLTREEFIQRMDEIAARSAARPSRDPLPLNEPVISPVRERPDIAGMQEIAGRVAQRPVLDTRSEKEICDEGWGL